jgi:hypothetical protein
MLDPDLIFRTAKGHEIYVQAILADGRIRVARAEDDKTIGTYEREHFENGTFTSTGRLRTAPIKEVPVTSKKSEKVAKSKKEAVAKEAAPKKEKAPKEPQVVFAFRLTEAQRDAIHKAAGPGKATRFVLAAALAAASGDRPALEELLATTKSNLK